MTVKNIFVPITGTTANSTSIDTALLLAKLFRAHVDALFIKEDVRSALRAAALDEARFAAHELIDSLEREQENAEKLVRQKFDDLLDHHRIDYREASLPADIPSAYWQVVEGAAVDEIELRGAAYDIIVAPRTEDKVATRPIVEAALFGTGCPVIVTPPEPPKVIGERILIGWNRGVPAARAVRYAMPFLEMAARVEIFSIATGAKKGSSAQEIARYLAWHNVITETKISEPDPRHVGEVLLAEAQDSGCDLLVLGAFSKSRLRQMVLGGVTNYVLQNAELPILMAH